RWNRWMDWFKQALDYQLELTDPVEFMHYLKTDLFENEIFVFTPAGELKQLPAGSTPIDFAYTVHSDVGNRCSAVRVNGRLVSFDYKLKSGDRVEVLTSPKAQPREKWLSNVRTSRARSKIRQWLRMSIRSQEEARGKELLKEELRRKRLPFPKVEALKRYLPLFGKGSLEKLYSSITRGKVSVQEVTRALYPESREKSDDEDSRRLERLREFVRRPVKGIKIDDMDNILVHFARCCQPVPGDSVIGIITKGHGVSVHRSDCRNVRTVEEPGRRIKVDWDNYPGQKFLVSLVVTARDRDGLAAEISRRVKDIDTDIRSGHFDIHEGELSLVLVVGINDLSHLAKVIAEIKGIDNVLSVRRAV
ncbi:MAG: bifunctional (p)ppGpp synthetase/guanosine-3',5'-bis(diphosphate) 3'-pyrophosphohydrolase, partial [Candidatus Krumholzibacteria bacterium]|nr:bifunctional (p)ppGpp synthetase/guanosine-3',5'-bis(diphosphate) 3'-pyrophosphohydrolase [Candidatus Krumholzibacteria bacterium]